MFKRSRAALSFSIIIAGLTSSFMSRDVRAQTQTIASLPWLGALSAGPRAQNYPAAQDNLDLWVLEDFHTSSDWLVGRFSSTGSGTSGGAGVTRDVFAVILDDLPPNGHIIMRSIAGRGGVQGGGVGGWNTFYTDFGNKRLPAGDYWVMWLADRDPASGPTVMFVQPGPHAVGTGLPENARRWNPGGDWNWATGPLDIVHQGFDITSPPTGVNFMLVGTPAPCIADLNGDQGVTLEDLLLFLQYFGDGDVRADLDDGSATGRPDSGVTVEDLLFFLAHYEVGC